MTMTTTTIYAAHDDLSIYALGATPQEAVAVARHVSKDSEAQFAVSSIDPAFAEEIYRNGFDPMSDTFHVVEGVIHAGRGY